MLVVLQVQNLKYYSLKLNIVFCFKKNTIKFFRETVFGLTSFLCVNSNKFATLQHMFDLRLIFQKKVVLPKIENFSKYFHIQNVSVFFCVAGSVSNKSILVSSV